MSTVYTYSLLNPTSDPPRSYVYSDSGNPNESPIFRHIDTKRINGGKLISTFRSQPDADTTIKLINGSAELYPDQHSFGERIINPNGSFGHYQWITYKEAQATIYKFASGLRKIGISAGDKLGIYSHNCRYWQISCFASQLIRAIPTPIYDSLGPGAAEYIVNHSNTKVIVAHPTKLKNISEMLSRTQIETVIVIGSITEEFQNVKMFTVHDVLNLGEHEEFEEPTPDDIGILMYTSGSTGKPKGCVLTHRNLIAGAAGLGQLGASITTSDFFFSFLPLAHIYAMGVELILMAQGGAIGFFTGDVRNLIADIQEFKPTIICGVPRVFNRIVSTMKTKIENLTGLKKTLVNWIIKHKIRNFKAHKYSSILLDIVLAPFKEALGGRVRMIVSGGAPILPEVYEFMKATLCPIIIQGYGLTECAAGLAVQESPEQDPTNVGGVTICSEVKLRKVEGLLYDPRGTPRSGELLVRGPHIFQEYFKEPRLTAEAKDGEWLCTGDIVTITEDGLVKIIDRAKQLVKLSQGEYISITSLNDIYGMSEKVKNIYIYADSHHDSPAAVIVPSDNQVKLWETQGITDPANSEAAKNEIIAELKIIHQKNKLMGFERISRIHLDLEEFTVDNGLLTPSMKPQWQALRKKYEAILVELLDNH